MHASLLMAGGDTVNFATAVEMSRLMARMYGELLPPLVVVIACDREVPAAAAGSSGRTRRAGGAQEDTVRADRLRRSAAGAPRLSDGPASRHSVRGQRFRVAAIQQRVQGDQIQLLQFRARMPR